MRVGVGVGDEVDVGDGVAFGEEAALENAAEEAGSAGDEDVFHRSRFDELRPCAAACRLEEEDCEDRHQGFERVAEAGLHGDEVVGERKQREGPREEDRSRDALLQREREAEKTGEAEKAVVQTRGRLRSACLFRGASGR